MRIDIHAHLRDGTLESDQQALLRMAAQLKLGKIAVSGIGTLTPGQEEIKRLNLAVESFAKAWPKTILGWCHVNPLHPDARHVLARGIEEQGMIGMKLWVATLCDDPKAMALARQCASYQVPVLVHAFHKCGGTLPGESTGEHVARLARAVPECTILMAHMGGNCLRELKPVQPYPNVHTDISGSICRRGDLAYAVSRLGAERVLFGTDAPLFPGQLAYGRLLEAPFSPQVKAKVMGENACRLLRLPLTDTQGGSYDRV